MLLEQNAQVVQLDGQQILPRLQNAAHALRGDIRQRMVPLCVSDVPSDGLHQYLEAVYVYSVKLVDRKECLVVRVVATANQDFLLLLMQASRAWHALSDSTNR